MQWTFGAASYISGRGSERFLLDAAALFAPLVAFVPTTVAPDTIPGIDVPCDDRCFPAEFEADAANGVLTYLIVGGLVVIVAVLLIALRQLSLRALGLSLGLTAVVLAAVGLSWFFARDAFLQQAHFAATIGFFALFAAAAVRNAFPRKASPPATVFRVLYTAIAVGLVLVLVLYIVLLPQAEDNGIPIVLLAEAAALVLFSAFWVVQCIEKWNEGDPSVIGRS